MVEMGRTRVELMNHDSGNMIHSSFFTMQFFLSNQKTMTPKDDIKYFFPPTKNGIKSQLPPPPLPFVSPREMSKKIPPPTHTPRF